MDEDKQVSVSLTANGFPLAAFKEWTADCKSRFGNCRWVKMMHDHQLAHIMPLIASFATKIEQLEVSIQELSTQPQEKEDVYKEPKTFGSELK